MTKSETIEALRTQAEELREKISRFKSEVADLTAERDRINAAIRALEWKPFSKGAVKAAIEQLAGRGIEFRCEDVVRAVGRECKRASVYHALHFACSEGIVRRVRRGVYRKA